MNWIISGMLAVTWVMLILMTLKPTRERKIAFVVMNMATLVLALGASIATLVLSCL